MHKLSVFTYKLRLELMSPNPLPHPTTLTESIYPNTRSEALSMHQCRKPYQSTRPAGLIKSPGPQAVSIHQARRPYRLTKSAGLINSPGQFFGLVGPFPVKPQISHSRATPLHRHPNPQLPYPTATPFTRSERLFDSPGPQALLIHKVRWPYQSTWPAGLIN